ncbi:glutathione hydrolase 6-like [Pectinophora gossypiella]|uniref:glutathione hydrolase 6-like n=1 Tax=Pectinophora gossypiella TaxID=13191 RepID=UPI00214ED095|nr:glutathione hydrolase 6-like [Pectinophora gossypiella]
MQVNRNADSQTPPGVVELREDVPLKAGSSLGADAGVRCCGGGPRFILACFAALSAGITLALLTQIYYGDYEVVPHGSVSSSAAACSRAGTDALKAGGRAIDAAATAALCLAVLAPHRTSLDASGSLLYWEYRTSHAQAPVLTEWGGPEQSPSNDTSRPPRLLAALASLHAKLGVLPWSRVLQPAITLAREGFPVSEGLSMSAAANNGVSVAPDTIRKAPLLADYLEKLQANTSSELAMSWDSDELLRSSKAQQLAAGAYSVYVGGAGGVVAGTGLAVALLPPTPDPDTGFQRVVSALQQASLHSEWPPTGIATGLAVVDRLDTYVALVTGLSRPFGSGPAAPGGWLYDEPKSQLDLAPAIIVDKHVCGTRYIIGAESSSALAQGATSLLTAGIGAGAVERARVSVYAGGVLAIEAMRDPPTGLPVTLPVPLVNATQPYPAVNVVMQKGDALQSHADSRGGGLASRF